MNKQIKYYYKYLLIVFTISLIGVVQGQDKDEIGELYSSLNKLDQNGDYIKLVESLDRILILDPNELTARSVLKSVFNKYSDEITRDERLLTLCFNHLDDVSIVPKFIALKLTYERGDFEKTEMILSQITQNDTDKFDIELSALSAFNPELNPELYNSIINSLLPYLKSKMDPMSLILMYNTKTLNIPGLELSEMRFASVKNSTELLYAIIELDPQIYPGKFNILFKKLIDLVPESTFDSIPTNEQLYKLGKLYSISGDTTNTLFIFKKLFAKISIDNRGIRDKFYYGISCIHEGQNYRAEKLFDEVFIYGNESEIILFKNELTFWETRVKSDRIIKSIKQKYFGIVDETVTEIDTDDEPVFDKHVIDTETQNLGRYSALIICVEEYKDSSIQDLNNPLNDGKRLRDVLINDYTFDSLDVKYLANPDRSALVQSLNTLKKELDESDNLLIFYAGHGIWDDDIEQGYWLPSDAARNDMTNWVSNSDLRDYIRGIKTKHTMLITDACFGGAIFKERDVTLNEELLIDEIYQYPSRRAITSGTIQAVPDKSVFIEFLLKRLSQNEEKYLLAKKLFFNFREAVINNSPNQQVPIYGAIYNAGDEGRGDFIFIKR